MSKILLLFLPVCLSQADPTCAHGLVAGTACCAASCGTCGGPNCGKLSGGSADCCVGSIAASNRSCAALPAPCTLAPPPAPPPAPPTHCGDFPAPLSASEKNVLLIGDSISMPVPFTPGGYGLNVKAALATLPAGPVNTWHAGGWESGGQASNTAKGMVCTNSSTSGNYLNFSGTFDVIHFKYALNQASEHRARAASTRVALPL